MLQTIISNPLEVLGVLLVVFVLYIIVSSALYMAGTKKKNDSIYELEAAKYVAHTNFEACKKANKELIEKNTDFVNSHEPIREYNTRLIKQNAKLKKDLSECSKAYEQMTIDREKCGKQLKKYKNICKNICSFLPGLKEMSERGKIGNQKLRVKDADVVNEVIKIIKGVNDEC